MNWENWFPKELKKNIREEVLEIPLTIDGNNVSKDGRILCMRDIGDKKWNVRHNDMPVQMLSDYELFKYLEKYNALPVQAYLNPDTDYKTLGGAIWVECKRVDTQSKKQDRLLQLSLTCQTNSNRWIGTITEVYFDNELDRYEHCKEVAMSSTDVIDLLKKTDNFNVLNYLSENDEYTITDNFEHITVEAVDADDPNATMVLFANRSNTNSNWCVTIVYTEANGTMDMDSLGFLADFDLTQVIKNLFN